MILGTGFPWETIISLWKDGLYLAGGIEQRGLVRDFGGQISKG